MNAQTDLYKSVTPSLRSGSPTNVKVSEVINEVRGLIISQMDAVHPHNLHDDLDLACSITGLYRVLDLITEQGSGGLVDKIIISQDSLKSLINTVCPGAYASLTKVNFKALDQYIIKPVGIYGSKEGIVRFLLELGVTDEAVAAQLLANPNTHGQGQRVLRSGLYILRPTEQQNKAEQVFVLYWPEENTWDDSAPSQVRRNRVTFMRYLTKMCDQIVALMSSEHSQSIIWNKADDEDSFDEDDEDGRIINCVVDRTTEQEESVQVREGFKVQSEHISLSSSTTDGPPDQVSMKPIFLFGETAQGFMTMEHQPAKLVADVYKGRFVTSFQLGIYLTSDHLCISESLDDQALKILVHTGLWRRFPEECDRWMRESTAIPARYRSRRDVELRTMQEILDREEECLTAVVHEAVVEEVARLYPYVPFSFSLPERSCVVSFCVIETFQEIVSLYPDADDIFRRHKDHLTKIRDDEFRSIKARLCLCVGFVSRTKGLESALCREVAKAASMGDFNAAKDVVESAFKAVQTPKTAYMQPVEAFKTFWSGITDQKVALVDLALREAHSQARYITDSQFFSDVINADFIRKKAKLKPSVLRAKELAYQYLRSIVPQVVTNMARLIKAVQENTCRATIEATAVRYKDEIQSTLRLQLIRHVNDSTTQTQHPYTLRIDSVDGGSGFSYFYSRLSDSYRISGARETQVDPMTCFTVHPMNLTEEDQHDLQLNPSFIPSPHFRFDYKFWLHQEYTIIHAQLLPAEKILLILADRLKNLNVYLESLTSIDGAIRRSCGKVLNREKIGQEFVLAFDESRRMLSVVSSDKLLLHIFVYVDHRGFQAQGSSISLNGWYSKGISIRHACFVSGSEEILLVDSQSQARIFSLVTMQFRPATLTLREIPSSVHSTPDGSCLLISSKHEAGAKLTAYHWNSFGSTDGTELNIPNLPVGESFVVTSLVSRIAVHLLWLDLSSHKCQSYALDITRRITEFMFREKFIRGTSDRATNTLSHNCLIDCHSEVWTRFPVLAAVQRETISSASIRSQRSVVFVTDRNFEMFAPHFSDMIYTFERTTKKPTGDVLKSTKVSAASFADFAQQLCGTKQWNVSQYLAGEWIVDFLCLIPIHIAVTKENRFVPLKDGVYSPELERSLLGAKVNHIVDSISFGWYESLFQSYMATKPVRVVSSMGEQSVGKSYALNHLVDTSFAGSAMRTTEGVWMSVNPTEKELVVALDFEGVHSIERSAQEDTLLVLFNTAITNLVLFRNNFALSRDITGLFQSFQSSATVLDPAANPSLFQSTLVIIIKDVVDADSEEIEKEFSLKFQRIVQDEQESNFITRLHAGKLVIIPWPVIESGDFYQLFPALKGILDQEAITHHAAGEFLHKMKALMAKLKANDWGAVSQTMASHRAHLLSTLLPNALALGFEEIHPELEPLKNLDTDVPIGLPDTQAQFFLAVGASPQSEARERALSILQSSWKQFETRQRIPDADWTERLSHYLDAIVNLRVDHVREWSSQNLTRFQSGHASIEEFRRTFEEAVIDLKSNVQLCKLQCASCQLLCIHSRFHDGPHSCQTSHLCIHNCDFCQEPKECSMPAGHVVQHTCVVKTHLCGKVCKFKGKFGCLHECIKDIGHVGEHLCAASVHACGKPCNLSGVKLADGSEFSCPGSCRIPIDVAHLQHECETSVCTIACQLCKRICSKQDHMHGLEDGEAHLCGQEHLCTSDCSAQGICEIETAPQSIEATFTGKHETFQYTKYSQVAKRLKCVKLIPPGATKHEGAHYHSSDTQVNHFCETKCENCGYFCTLPIGHPEQEHDTRHGSMSRTRWAVDGPDDTTALEVEGRKFSANDEGAPMMCNLLCQSLGRHVHIDYCRSDVAGFCVGYDEIQHIDKRLLPDPDRPKDYITHSLFWKRSGFKDPYSKEEQATFAKCDIMCNGPEHTGDAGNPPQPSYCTLPMFHPRSDPSVAPALGHISHDGHHFNCRMPVVMQEAYHFILRVDLRIRSGSMSSTDRRPLESTPTSVKIRATSDNRFGAVLSSLFSFWSARAAAIGSSGSAVRRDAYSVILFDDRALTVIENDLTSTPDQLLDSLLRYKPESRTTDFTKAIIHAQGLLKKNWNTARSPVIVFLSDGQSKISDETMKGLCRTSVQLGKAVSFHAVLFGPDKSSTYLRRMTEIAKDAQNNASKDPFSPPVATVKSTYAQALDTVQLAESFLGIAESLRKRRGALMH
ncbi:hypothetical protein V8B97DRAFT_1873723 [Scleroderma yunnanense]